MNERSLAASSRSFSGPGSAGAPAAPPAVRAPGVRDRAKLMEQAVEFEAVYLSEMLKPMFDGMQAAAPFGGGFGEDVWRSQQLQEFARAIARQGGIGLANTVARELIRAQEAHDTPPSKGEAAAGRVTGEEGRR